MQEIEKKVKSSKEPPRTNIFIQDEELWNWAKFQSKSRGYNSVSEYIFRILNVEKNTEVLNQNLLQDIEKYFELNHYTLGDIANKNEISLEFLNRFLITNSIPLDNENKAISRVHNLLLERKLAPREFHLYKKFSNILKLKGDLPNKREILTTFYEDEVERRNEVFSMAYELIQLFSEILVDSTNKKFDSLTQDIISILYNSGIDPDKENDIILEDENYSDFKEKNMEHYYFLAFNIAGWAVISRDLLAIFTYFLSNSFDILKVVITKLGQLLNKIKEIFSSTIQNEPKTIQEKLLKFSPVIPPINDLIFENISGDNLSYSFS